MKLILSIVTVCRYCCRCFCRYTFCSRCCCRCRCCCWLCRCCCCCCRRRCCCWLCRCGCYCCRCRWLWGCRRRCCCRCFHHNSFHVTRQAENKAQVKMIL